MIPCLYPCFRHWAEKGSVYVFSDPHFADDDCLLMDAEWIPPDEQVAILNKTMFKSDTFVCLGDVGDPSYAAKVRAGHKVLLLGNHDRKRLYTDIFDEVYDGPLFIADKVLLSHEPVSGLPFCLNIHGHDHNGMEKYDQNGHYLNVAANVCNYTPVNLGRLIKGGILSKIDSIHRLTIDAAAERKSVMRE